MDPIITPILVGTAVGGGIGAFQGRSKKRAYADQGALASTQSGWSGLSGGPMGQIGPRPDMIGEIAGGAMKGGMTGFGMYTDYIKAMKPESAVTNINSPVSSIPGGGYNVQSLEPSPSSMSEIQANIDAGRGAYGGGSRGPASIGFKQMRKPTGQINTVPQMNPWFMYGGTGGK